MANRDGGLIIPQVDPLAIYINVASDAFVTSVKN